jgi:anti-anti-sigma factor
MATVGHGSLDFERGPATLRVIARGEFDLANVATVERAIADERGANTREATIDLSDVTFMDSKMLEYLVRLHRSLAARRAHLRLHPNLNARKLLALTGLDALLELVDD